MLEQTAGDSCRIGVGDANGERESSQSSVAVGDGSKKTGSGKHKGKASAPKHILLSTR